MRFKILAHLLVLVLIILLGLNVHFYFTTVDRQAKVNDMLGLIVLSWAESMGTAGLYLKNANTNIDVSRAGWVLEVAEDIGEAGYKHAHTEPYSSFRATASIVRDNLFLYMVGSPLSERNISPTALSMSSDLAEKIWNSTNPINSLVVELRNRNGVDPMQLLEDKDILDDIISHCIEVQEYSEQMHDFNPKFQ